MLSFKEYILEALNRAQKQSLGIEYSNRPSYAAQEISNHVMGDQDHIDIPITHDSKKDVQEHLERHGFKLGDYKAGTAIDKHGRTTSIGKVLNNPKTKAPDSLIKNFTNDSRDNVSEDTHHIVLSRDPEHIGECSTNKSWKSCAGLTPSGRPTTYGGGVAAKKLRNAIVAGSHVAYLMKNGQSNIEKADARVLLHPYHAYDSEGNITHSVLMPEGKVYSKAGGRQSNFVNSVESYARKNFPMKPGVIYQKDPTVYDDDRDYYRFDTSPASVKKIITNPNIHYGAKERAIQSVQLPHQTITSLLSMKGKNDKEQEAIGESHGYIAEHQKISDAHVGELLNSGHGTALARNKNLTKSQVNQIVYHEPPEDYSDDYKKHLNRIKDQALTSLVRSRPKDLTSDHINHIISRNDPGTLNTIGSSQGLNLTSDHIHKILTSKPNLYPEDHRNAKVNQRISEVHSDALRSVAANHGHLLTDDQKSSIIHNPETSAGTLRGMAAHAKDHQELNTIMTHPNADAGVHGDVNFYRKRLIAKQSMQF